MKGERERSERGCCKVGMKTQEEEAKKVFACLVFVRQPVKCGTCMGCMSYFLAATPTISGRSVSLMDAAVGQSHPNKHWWAVEYF